MKGGMEECREKRKMILRKEKKPREKREGRRAEVERWSKLLHAEGVDLEYEIGMEKAEIDYKNGKKRAKEVQAEEEEMGNW